MTRREATETAHDIAARWIEANLAQGPISDMYPAEEAEQVERELLKIINRLEKKARGE